MLSVDAKPDKPIFRIIDEAESIIYNSNITKLDSRQKEVMLKHRQHLISKMKFYRQMLELNYKKCNECDEALK
jgi:hypothetical protein